MYTYRIGSTLDLAPKYHDIRTNSSVSFASCKQESTHVNATCELEVVWPGKSDLFTWYGGDCDVVRAAFDGPLLPNREALRKEYQDN
jgi:hypothetical protein